jgi:hypothetical protein
MSIGHLVQMDNFMSKVLGEIYCGNKMRMNKWAEDCSHYNGPSTKLSSIKNTKMKVLLEQLKPEVCSYVPEVCNFHHELSSRFSSSTTHYVKSLQLVHRDAIGDEYVCVGKSECINNV